MVQHRRLILITYDSLVWLIAIASFTALRYVDSPEGMPRQTWNAATFLLAQQGMRDGIFI